MIILAYSRAAPNLVITQPATLAEPNEPIGERSLAGASRRSLTSPTGEWSLGTGGAGARMSEKAAASITPASNAGGA